MGENPPACSKQKNQLSGSQHLKLHLLRLVQEKNVFLVCLGCERTNVA